MTLVITLLLFLVLLVIGVPVWLSLTFSSGLLAFFVMDISLASIISQFLTATDSWLLLAIPYFLLAGNLMTNLGIAKKMLDFIIKFIGHLPGGLPATAVVSCMIFGALSGSSAATVIAVGSMIIPQMIKVGYSKETSMGIVATSGTLGQMVPPSVYLIVYGSMTQTSVGELFIAGVIPGVVITIVLVLTAIILTSKVSKQLKGSESADKIIKAFLNGLPGLLMPVIVLGGIYTGVFTPTEAAAVSVVYVLSIAFAFNRKEITKQKVYKSIVSSMKTTTMIYILLAGATVFSMVLTYAKIPMQITEYVTNVNLPGWVILIFILLLFLFFGLFLDALPILYITIPIVFPVVVELGYDPIHFGIITVACMMISQVTPPVGVSLFVLSGHFKEPLSVIIRGSFPYLIGLIVATIILIYLPSLSTFLIE